MAGVNVVTYYDSGEIIRGMSLDICFSEIKQAKHYGYKIVSLNIAREVAIAWIQDLTELGLWVNQTPEEVLNKYIFKLSDWETSEKKVKYNYTAILCGGTLIRYLDEEPGIVTKYFELLQTIPDITKIQAIQLAHYKGNIYNNNHTSMCGGFMCHYYKYSTLEEIKERFYTSPNLFGVWVDSDRVVKKPDRSVLHKYSALKLHEVLSEQT